MNVVFTHHSFQYLNIQAITHLPNQITTSRLNLTLQYFIPVFGTPYKMNMQLVNTMCTSSNILHPANLCKICRS